ncbi:hypothetical protein [Nocardia huaxiensis]|uniref:hypothetical protein n=1 Tax=Nocardia huaxiensis TaxID=2755382 RepID=UPI001C670A9C|nr:hypothetical protein [Nocardia huaxiensis]
MGVATTCSAVGLLLLGCTGVDTTGFDAALTDEELILGTVQAVYQRMNNGGTDTLDHLVCAQNLPSTVGAAGAGPLERLRGMKLDSVGDIVIEDDPATAIVGDSATAVIHQHSLTDPREISTYTAQFKREGIQWTWC